LDTRSPGNGQDWGRLDSYGLVTPVKSKLLVTDNTGKMMIGYDA
jgi:hypothetical protein